MDYQAPPQRALSFDLDLDLDPDLGEPGS